MIDPKWIENVREVLPSLLYHGDIKMLIFRKNA